MSADLQQRSQLSRRLTVALVVPIGLLVVLGVVLGRQILRMAEDADLVAHTHEVVAVANETKTQIIDQETAIRGYLLGGDRVFLEPFDRATPSLGFVHLQTLTADNPTQQMRFAQARERYETWLGLVEDARAGRDLAAARSIEQMLDRKRVMDAMRQAMRAAIDAEESLLKDRTIAAESSESTTRILFVVLLGISAVVIGVLSRSQLGSIAATFTAALAAETASRKAVEREAWIRAGHAKLADALQGDQTVEQLGQRSLTVLAELTNASVGAFFTRDGRAWVRRAGHALDTRAGGADRFDDGAGMVGTAAGQAALLDVRDVPGAYLKVRSGTGEVSPVQLVLVPARVDGAAHAVVELGFLQAADERAVELLGRISEVVAVAVRSADQRHRLHLLLEETQRQAEELQTQQEEMRVQNEELEQQTRALQDSQARLANQHAELEQINTQLEEQAQHLEKQRDELGRAESEAQRANTYKSEFLANMSHELRTPLNSSLILAKLLADNRQGNLDAEQIKFAETIYSAGNDLLTLINDILDLSKIEAGKLDVRPEDVSLPRLRDELANLFQPLAKDKGLALSIEIDDAAPASIYTDATRLPQILKNLVSNALKFTERGGVTLRMRGAGDGRVAFDVQDTGIGIAPEQQEVIFEAFRQADGTTNRKYGGTGLGLSISRDLARLLGGDLVVTSAPGRGSTFTVTLPERLASSEGRPVAPLPTALPRPARKQAAPAPAMTDDRDALSGGGRSILIIEDDAGFARILHDLAHELDFRALVAPTAEQGLALARQHRPSAIVLDIGLPDRSGLSVLDALKHDPVTRHIPVHVMSASDHAQTALEMGALGYAIKPVQREQLVEALRRLESKFTQELRRVLVVEDDEVLRDSTRRLLQGEGVEIEAVGTAAEALARIKATTYDCMVLDLSLPDRSGLELLEEMSRTEGAFPPVIVYTGRSLSRDEEQQLRRFSQSIIIKGARSPERLLDEVTLFLHQVEAELPPERQRMLRDARHRESVFEGRRILVVEDDVRNIFALSSVLEPKGAKVEIARNGREALDHLRDKPGVDLVLMDIMMPEMDGLEATREIRKQPELAKLPVIALTAKAMIDDRENCLAAGANDYIAKPLDVDKLLSLARVWMPK